MFPYRIDPPAPPVSVAPEPRRRFGRLLGTVVLMSLVALTSAGAGIYAATTWLVRAPELATAPPALVPAIAPIGAQTIAGFVYDQASPAVIEVAVGQRFGNAFRTSSGGSGFVVDASGLILTNYHVVSEAPAIEVRFKDGTRRAAEIVVTDAASDLAVLRVDLPGGTPVLQFADSDSVRVGEPAIAIGSPFGLAQTVTQGIISATGRSARDLIQTDAPINPGNSGGPLLNATGQVIGVNTQIASPIRGSVGVGFAVPSNTARALLEQAS
jgi:S1-C subfamily serine protease